MMFALIFTAFAAGLATAIAAWPFFGASAFFVAPFGASLATFAAGAVLTRNAPMVAQEKLDSITDRLVADLRSLTDAAARPEAPAADLQRKAG